MISTRAQPPVSLLKICLISRAESDNDVFETTLLEYGGVKRPLGERERFSRVDCSLMGNTQVMKPGAYAKSREEY